MSVSQRKPTRSRRSASRDKKRRDYVPGFRFDEDRAERVIKFLETVVVMTEGRWAGKPMKVLPWQRDIIESLFGWVDENERRRYRRGAVYIAKKQGKSTLMAGLALYALLADGEAGAYVAIAACDRYQAGIIFRTVAACVRASPHLSRILEVVDSRSTIIHKASNSRLVAIGADAFRSEGLSCSMVIVDELHAHAKPDLVQTLLYSGAAREQPLVIAISTAGSDRNGIGYEWWLDAALVEKTPDANKTMFGRIYAASEEDDFSDPEVWRKANPSLGVTVSEESFRADYEDAMTNPRKMSAFMRYRLNIWVEKENRWFDADKVAACMQPPPSPLAGRQCWVGLDIASTLDMTAAAFLFKDEHGCYDAVMKFWVPEETVGTREKVDGLPYSQWIRDGWLSVTNGARLDHARVANDIIEFCSSHQGMKVITDPWNAGPIATFLQGAGIETVSLPQTTSRMNAPCKLLESLVVGKQFRYESPILQWMMNNVVIMADDTESIKPTKAKSREKIDGVVAVVNALAEASLAPDAWEVFVF